MSSDYDNIKSDDSKFDRTIAELRAGLTMSKEKTANFDADSYHELREKYEKAIEVIELQRNQIQELSKNKLPTKDEVDTISSMLELINKLDDKTMEKIEKLGKKNG